MINLPKSVYAAMMKGNKYVYAYDRNQEQMMRFEARKYGYKFCTRINGLALWVQP